MKWNEATIRILVRKNYGECFDFYTKQIGLIPVWGDRNGPYTSFAVRPDEAPCFAIFKAENMEMFSGYDLEKGSRIGEAITVVIPTENLDQEYKRLKEVGVLFLGEPQYIEDWGMRVTYFGILKEIYLS